jgi:hypothetical protein
MATACRLGVESVNLMFPSTFGDVPTVYMSYGPNESFVPKQQRKQYVSVVYCWQRNERQEFGPGINMKFCQKIRRSARETLVRLTLALGDYAMKKSNVFEWHRRFQEGREYVQVDPRIVQPQTERTHASVDRVWTVVRSDRRLGVELKNWIWMKKQCDMLLRKFWEWGNFPQRWCHESWQITGSDSGFTIQLIFHTTYMKLGVFNMTQNENVRALSGEYRSHLGREKHTSRSHFKTTLVCFFDHKGIVRYELFSQGETATHQCYMEMLTKLRECFQRKRSELWPDRWIIHHGSALRVMF